MGLWFDKCCLVERFDDQFRHLFALLAARDGGGGEGQTGGSGASAASAGGVEFDVYRDMFHGIG